MRLYSAISATAVLAAVVAYPLQQRFFDSAPSQPQRASEVAATPAPEAVPVTRIAANSVGQAPLLAAAGKPEPPRVAPAPVCPGNPDALGTTRVVEIDTTGGPGFGFEHFKIHNFLRQNEVVLTFDDGPWPNTTPAVLKALAEQCVKATFFAIGKHATWHPDILRDVAAQGHTVGTHTWSHVDLSRKKLQEAKDEVEKGVSAVKAALGSANAPFFRFPQLKHPPELVTYLGERNIAMFSTDLDSFDFKMRKAEKMVDGLMAKLQKHGKGILLMHDFQQVTAEGLPELLKQLKAGGYKIVHLKAKDAVTTLSQYDEMMTKDQRLPTVSSKPTASVVKTISGE
jgi:peptidoglycan/xylan/chitin deacetylase (PgdA/CDA1 family)